MEIDFLIKKGDFILPIEVKTTLNPNRSDAKSLQIFLNEYFEDDSGIGIIVYPGKEIYEVRENIYAVPDWFLLS